MDYFWVFFKSLSYCMPLQGIFVWDSLEILMYNNISSDRDLSKQNLL